MPVFNEIPENQRLSIFSTELRARAGIASNPGFKVLLVGSGTQNVPISRIENLSSAENIFGKNQIYDMAKEFFELESQVELFGIQRTIAGGTASSVAVTFSGTSTSAGVLAIYINDKRLAIPIANGRASADVASDVKDFIDSSDLNFTTTAVGSVLTITNTYVGNYEVFVSFNKFSTDVAIPGITQTAAPTAGTGSISYSNIVSNLDDQHYNLVVSPDSLKTTIDPLIAEMDNRFSADNQLEGMILICKIDTFSNLGTLGRSYNSQFVSLLGINGVETPSHLLAAAAASVWSNSLFSDPARPLATLNLGSLASPSAENQFSKSEQNSLLFSGVTPLSVNANSQLVFVNTISTYRTNDQGQIDISFLNVNYFFTYSRLRQEWNGKLLRTYPRYKIVSDDSRPNPGQEVVSPSQVLSLFSSEARRWEGLAWIQNSDELIRNSTAEINSLNPNRIDLFVSVKIVGQLEIIASLLTVRLI